MVMRDPRRPVPPIATMAERLAESEKKWTEANERQRATINRLMDMREKVLALIADAKPHQINEALRRKLNKELNP